MTADPQYQAALALHRFGLGPRAGTMPGSIAAVAADPRGALLAELEKPGVGQIVDSSLMTAPKAAMAAFNFREARQAAEIAAKMAEQERAAAMANAGTMANAETMGNAQTMGNATEAKPMEPTRPTPPASAVKPTNAAPPKPATPPEPTIQQRIVRGEARARFMAAHAAEIGFVERLVWFWSNHLCVSSIFVPFVAGGYEREAIRPHVLGRFEDMLNASASHPAMLQYLDNARSVGPKSVAGLIYKAGLNENYARELLELHTLGVRTGYTQDDVISLAKVFTGWTILPAFTNPEHGVEFVFNPRIHEPGPKVVLGKSYADRGVGQGRDVLADLAHHPATAEHVARKLARHFVADDPPAPLVDRLALRFRDTEGDLKEMARALVAAPEAWDMPPNKLKRPNEWLTAMGRALPLNGDVVQALRTRIRMGEQLWGVPQPEGFSDLQADWVDTLAQRLDVAEIVAARVEAVVDPQELVDATLGSLASPDTRRAVARADSRQQALTIALMAPEFHRR
jgi:uncharacterized protein (DUF1800 family)